MDIIEKFAPGLFILVAIVLMIIFGYIATTGEVTKLESIVFQLLSLLAALVGSYIFGRRISKEKINEIIEPSARSAFRRLITLYKSISMVAIIASNDDDRGDSLKLQIIEAIALEQIQTANDALADWEDIAPKSVNELTSVIRFNNDGK